MAAEPRAEGAEGPGWGPHEPMVQDPNWAQVNLPTVSRLPLFAGSASMFYLTSPRVPSAQQRLRDPQKWEQKVLEGAWPASASPKATLTTLGRGPGHPPSPLPAFLPPSLPQTSPQPAPGDRVGPLPGVRGARGAPSWKPTCRLACWEGACSGWPTPGRRRFLDVVTVHILFLVSTELAENRH